MIKKFQERIEELINISTPLEMLVDEYNLQDVEITDNILQTLSLSFKLKLIKLISKTENFSKKELSFVKKFLKESENLKLDQNFKTEIKAMKKKLYVKLKGFERLNIEKGRLQYFLKDV